MRLHLTIASRILALQIVVVAAVVIVGAAGSVLIARQQLDREYAERALAVADSVAVLPLVREAVLARDPTGILQPLAESIRTRTGASFVVITDRDGIRFSHPEPARIGERVSTDPEPALSGHRWTGVQQGTLGVSVRGKVPIFGAEGDTVIGIVSVGFLQEAVGSRLTELLPLLGLSLVVALVLGTAGSLFLARRLKRQTFGLEPVEIAGLLEQREAILHGIREGTVAVDAAGRITLVNDEARRLLGLGPDSIGQQVMDVLPAENLRDIVLGRTERPDQLILTNGRVLVANRMPVFVRGEVTGAVITFRDRTELEGALRELAGVRSVADALRAQAHEFSNRLHTIVGLIELGRHDEAIRLSTEEATVHQDLIETLLGRVGEPALSALLLAKSVVASERGVSLRISDDTLLVRDVGDPQDLITIVGNLIDNAIDAVALSSGTRERWVDVAVRAERDAVEIRVRDSGPGIDPVDASRVFDEGYTTKASGGTRTRGLGLALVQQVVRRRGGDVGVTNDGGAVFTVRLPVPAARSAPSGDGLRGDLVEVAGA